MPQKGDYVVEDMQVLKTRHDQVVNPVVNGEQRTKDFRTHYRDKQVCICIC
jgi:hypothetical protein